MSKLKAIAAGAVGGIAGAALMGPVHSLASKLNGNGHAHGADATEKVANAIASTVTGRRLRYSQRKKGGVIVHFAFAATVGALYALLAEEYPSLTSARGTLMGAALYGGAHTLTVPALGLARSPLKNGLAQESAELASHFVYGLVAETVRRVIA